MLRRACFLASVALTIAGGTFAQTSSVVLAPLAPFSPEPSPVPVTPLEILDSDYPLASLIANEEGQTVLNLILTQTGAVRVAQIVASSGSPALDDRAAQVARTRWSFRPTLRDGAPIATEVKAAVIWKLPLSPRDEYAMDAPGPSAISLLVPPFPKPGNRLFESDYPVSAWYLGKEGEVILKSAIDETGAVTDVQLVGSSGIPLLDQAAMKAVRGRWAYEPATLDGKSTAATMTTFVIFELSSYRRAFFCHDRPVFSTYDRNSARTPSQLFRWLLMRDSLRIDDALLRTSKGWLQVSKSALPLMAHSGNYRLVRNLPAALPCWIRVSGPIPP